MVFGDICKTLLNSASEKMQNMSEEYNSYRERYENVEDQQLIRYYRNASGVKKMALASLLRDRGYGTDNAD